MSDMAYSGRMEVFEALSQDSRRQILDLVATDERPVGELVGALGLSQPAVSKHLRVLREAGLVQVRVDGPRRLYRVLPDRLREVDEWLSPYRRMWSQRLDALERHLDRVADG
jgi:DNA-binding transcriptional ArsR family regulator